MSNKGSDNNSVYRDQSRRQLNVNGKSYDYFSLAALEERFPSISSMPFSRKVLLENLLRHEDGETVTRRRH